LGRNNIGDRRDRKEQEKYKILRMETDIRNNSSISSKSLLERKSSLTTGK
jgi:hypothetical protein